MASWSGTCCIILIIRIACTAHSSLLYIFLYRGNHYPSFCQLIRWYAVQCVIRCREQPAIAPAANHPQKKYHIAGCFCCCTLWSISNLRYLQGNFSLSEHFKSQFYWMPKNMSHNVKTIVYHFISENYIITFKNVRDIKFWKNQPRNL